MSDVILIPFTEEKLRDLVRQAIRAEMAETQKADIPQVPELLTRKDAAQFLGVSIATIDNWTKQGKIDKHYNGSAVRLRKSELEESFQNLIKYKR